MGANFTRMPGRLSSFDLFQFNQMRAACAQGC
jgi:hypothetical protein